jgi:hypothetical protein
MGDMGFRRFWRRRPGRRPSPGARWGVGAVAAASASLLVAGTVTMLAPAAGADIGLTEGSSSAQAMWVGPHEGSLAVGAIFGVALAGNTGTSAKAQSEGVDLGAVGESLETDNCGQPPALASLVPQPLIVESGEPGASQGISQGPSQSDYFANEYGRADNTPYAEADTTYGGPLADPTNAIVVSGMHSKAWSGVVNGVDEAGASTDIGSISLGGGAVVLDGLRWLSVSPTNGGGQPTGEFDIGRVLVAGTALPSTDALSQVASAVNQVLGQLGIEVNFPVSSVEQGIQSVSPLQIEVVPNANRDSVVDPVVTGLGPTYYQIANGLENGFSDPGEKPPFSSLGQVEPSQLAAALCQSDTPITVGDVTIASFDGGGYFSAELGGVSSSDGPLALGNYNLGLLSPGSLVPGTTNLTAGTPGTPGTLGTLGTPVSPGAGAPGGAGSVPSRQLTQAARAGLKGFSAGGPLLGAGLGALALLAALVEGDRQLMRRARKATAAVGAQSTEGAGEGGGPEG